MIADGELETAVEMARALRSGAVGGDEPIQRARHRAEAWQPAINAFSQLWPEPEPIVPDRWLSGVPVGVKDLFDVGGRPTTGCCAAYEGRIADRDAPTVARVRSAGLAMFGKTNQHELAFGGTNLYSSAGRTGNPWDPSRMTGGSSGGSAAAVAAGIVPFALGSDTGGSIRIPASLCGTFGLKVTTGSLPLDGMLPLAPSLDTPGPIAATASDLAVLYRVLAGENPDDAPGPPPPACNGIRFGLLGGYFARHVVPEVTHTVGAVAATFETLGGLVEPVDGEGIDDNRAVWRAVVSPEFADAHPILRERLDVVLDPDIRRDFVRGARATAEERGAAARRRDQTAAWFASRLDGHDVLLAPSTVYPAQPADATELVAGAETIDLATVGPGWCTAAVNLAGLPAVSVPAGHSTDGMPYGVTLIGPPRSEDRLLDLALLWEAATGYVPPRPALPGS
jgi:aspartyl-tRNA(Asn)/glutamyl-tRNA(Gln) amidotransferase subunit A